MMASVYKYICLRLFIIGLLLLLKTAGLITLKLQIFSFVPNFYFQHIKLTIKFYILIVL
jgi:hypothetical protein